MICYAFASIVVGWLFTFTVWVATDLDSAMGTVLGIGELDCNREGEDCGSWSELIAAGHSPLLLFRCPQRQVVASGERASRQPCAATWRE
jgi:hypothetical protein